VNIHEIARHLKFSPSTISRALNPAKQHLISAEVRERIQDYARRMKFVPSSAARELTTGKTHHIGVIVPTAFDSFFFNDHLTKILEGVYKVLAERGSYRCKLIIIPPGQNFGDLDEEIRGHRIDGLLVSALSNHLMYSSYYYPKDFLANWNKPVMLVGIKLKSSKHLSYAHSDNFEAARKAITYLLRKGYRRIAMIQQVPEVPDARERLKGYLAALKDHRIEVRENLIVKGRMDLKEERRLHPPPLTTDAHNLYPIERGYKITLGLFEPGGPKPTAIFCANDETALGALRALRFLGMRSPQDVAVMGFDGLDAGELVDPRLSTVKQPTFEMAEWGTRALLDMIEGKIKGPVSRLFTMPLLLRDSA